MRILIDGYNLMHATVLVPGQKLTGKALERARERFLDRLAGLLGPVESALTLVVFDSPSAPARVQGDQVTAQGIRVEFATADPTADDRIIALVRAHPRPAQLTVVSSDAQIRAAAQRRGARAVGSDAFWVELEDRQSQARRAAREQARQDEREARQAAERTGPRGDATDWAATFADVDDLPETHELRGRQVPTFSDAEIARIEREIAAEEPGPPRRKPR